MFIKSSVSIPIVKSVTTVFRCISIPCRYAVFHIFSRALGVIGVGKSACSLPKYAQSYPALLNTSLTQSTSSRNELIGRFELQFKGIPLLLGYMPVSNDPGEDCSTGNCSWQRSVPKTLSQNHSDEEYAPDHSGNSLSPENLPDPRTPLPDCGTGRENINNIRLLGLLCLRSFTTLQGEQA